MTETGAPPVPDQPPLYAAGQGPNRIRHVKLALFLSSLAACLSVTLLGLLGTAFVYLVMSLFGVQHFYQLNGAFGKGAVLGVQMATYNFILFFITVPAAWLAMGLSIGRFPHRGIVQRAPYLRWAAIWGTLLVGGTTGLFGTLISGPLGGFAALLTGGMIGAVAGLLCGLLFLAIVKPAEQLHQADISVF